MVRAQFFGTGHFLAWDWGRRKKAVPYETANSQVPSEKFCPIRGASKIGSLLYGKHEKLLCPIWGVRKKRYYPRPTSDKEVRYESTSKLAGFIVIRE